MMENRAIQDSYADELSHCYGCGRLNTHGLGLKSYSDGEETAAVFEPRHYHTAVPGFVYGGLIASLFDCHGTGSAAIAACRVRKLAPGKDPVPRFVTASLKVDYLRPTPLGGQLQLRGRIKEQKGRKVVVSMTLSAGGRVTARAELVAVAMPEGMLLQR
jgi:acyl-coenzyme A thioesterase PaaI-like protein